MEEEIERNYFKLLDVASPLSGQLIILLLHSPSAEIQAKAVAKYIPGTGVERIENMLTGEVFFNYSQKTRPKNVSACGTDGLNMGLLLNILPEKPQ